MSKPFNFTKEILKRILWSYYHLLYRFKIEGAENLPEDTGYILCANHINLNDPLVVGITTPGYIGFMAKKELFENILLATVLRFAGAFPVDRESNDIGAVKNAFKILKEKRGLLIFAEGTRNNSRTPLEAKAGVAMIASKAKVPVVPVMIDSSYGLFKTIRIRFFPQVSLEDLYGVKTEHDEYQKRTQIIINQVYEDMQYHGRS